MFIKTGFIGAGNMAAAIINGMLGSKQVPAENIYVFDLDQDKMRAMREQGVQTVSDAAAVVTNCDLIVLAVKPQNYGEVLQGLQKVVTEEKVFVSIAAGISTSYVTDNLQCGCPVVRVMPNTPLLLGKGATALCATKNIPEDKFQAAYTMFANSGTVEILEEEQMNAVIAVNGSSPAYVYLFAKAMADYAQAQGIDHKKAINLICSTLEGSAAMLRESGDDADTLIQKVSSPGGTTVAALGVLNETGFYNSIIKAMEACTNRAEELGK